MVKLLFITDTHLQSIAPVGRSDNYLETGLKKLEEVSKLAHELNVDALIHGGDLFNISRVSFRLMIKVAEFFYSLPCPAYVLPGNHDVQGYSLNVLPNTSLGFLSELKVFSLLQEPVKVNDAIIYPLPLTMFPNPDAYQVPKGDIKIIVAHDNTLPKAVHPNIPHIVITPKLSNADLVLLGHWHSGWPEPYKSGKTTYVNPGSLLRTARGSESENRSVSVAYIEAEPGNITVNYIPLRSAKPYTDVFTPQDKGTILDVQTLTHQFDSVEVKVPDVLSILEAGSNKRTVEIVKETLKRLGQDMTAPLSWERTPAIINDLVIEGFQSHVKSHLKLQPGLNVITGKSEKGKSAIIRAIDWLFHDKPKGDANINVNCKRQQVTARFADGSIIKRSRTRSSAGKYEIRNKDGKRITFTSLREGVPLEIQEIHRSPTVKLADEAVDILTAHQFDPPFLIGWPGGKVASILDEVARNTLSVEAVREMQRYANEAKQQAENLESYMSTLEMQIKTAQAVEAMAPDVEALLKEIDSYKKNAKHLEELRELQERYSSLLVLEEQFEGINIEDLDGYESTLSKANEAIEELIEQYSIIRKIVTIKNTLAKKYTSVFRRLQHSAGDLSQKAKSYTLALGQSGLCPLCNRPWDGKHESKHILKEVQEVQDKLEKAKSALSAVEETDADDLEELLEQLKARRKEYETSLAEARASLALVKEYIEEKDSLEKECQEKYGIPLSSLEAEVNKLTKIVEKQIRQLEEMLQLLEEENSSLMNALAGAQTEETT